MTVYPAAPDAEGPKGPEVGATAKDMSGLRTTQMAQTAEMRMATAEAMKARTVLAANHRPEDVNAFVTNLIPRKTRLNVIQEEPSTGSARSITVTYMGFDYREGFADMQLKTDDNQLIPYNSKHSYVVIPQAVSEAAQQS